MSVCDSVIPGLQLVWSHTCKAASDVRADREEGEEEIWGDWEQW